jgi:hypothetical protein
VGGGRTCVEWHQNLSFIKWRTDIRKCASRVCTNSRLTFSGSRVYHTVRPLSLQHWRLLSHWEELRCLPCDRPPTCLDPSAGAAWAGTYQTLEIFEHGLVSVTVTIVFSRD